MRIRFIRGMCDNTRTCPNINLSDRETYVVQGYTTTSETGLPADEAVVELPLSLLPELNLTRPSSDLVPTGRDSVLVRGRRITDPDVLAELNLPAGEDAVEVPTAVLGELGASHVG